MSLKSNTEDLRKRGMIKQADIDRVSNYSSEQLIKGINAETPAERSAVIRILSQRNGFPNELCTKELLKRLSIEKALYTKLEICKALEQGGCETAGQMTEYLGMIGTNQHKFLPEKVSLKKSFPLPRDIIARTMGNMNPSILPTLLEVLSKGEKKKIYEALDAIGLLVFYHPQCANAENLTCILYLLKIYPEDEMILWKVTLCLSAFPSRQSVETLNRIKQAGYSELISDEAERSLKIIVSRPIAE